MISLNHEQPRFTHQDLHAKQVASIRWMVGLFVAGVFAVTTAVSYLLTHADDRYASKADVAVTAREVETIRQKQSEFDRDIEAIHESLTSISVKIAKIELHLEQLTTTEPKERRQ